MSNALEESCLRHSASDFTTFVTCTIFRRSPESENRTIVTSCGAPAAAATSTVREFFHDHNAKPPRVAAVLARNMRRVRGAPFACRSESNIFCLQEFKKNPEPLTAKFQRNAVKSPGRNSTFRCRDRETAGAGAPLLARR